MDPGVLAVLGPLVVGEWSVPTALANQLRAEGKPIPAPVRGHMLIDTGAAKTAIGLRVAEELGLKPLGVQHTYGAHGRQESARYFARWCLRIVDRTAGLEVGNDIDCIAIPNLEETFAPHAKNSDGSALRVVGIIGREFLRHTRFTYDGPKGEVTFEIELAGLRPES